MYQKKRKILRANHNLHVNKTLHSAIMKCSQLKIKAIKSKSKNDVIEYKKQHNVVVKVKKSCKKDFLTGQLLSHTSPINMQRLMQIFSLLKIIKFYLIIVKQQMFSTKLLFNNQSLKTLTCLNGQMSRNLTFLMKLT